MCILHIIKKIDICHFYRLSWRNQFEGKLCPLYMITKLNHIDQRPFHFQNPFFLLSQVIILYWIANRLDGPQA
jgi:hypothetical protein